MIKRLYLFKLIKMRLCLANWIVFASLSVVCLFVYAEDANTNTLANQSCIHRKERRLNQNPPIHNKALQDLFDRYANLHKQSITTENVVEAFRRPIDDPVTDIKSKYIVLLMHNGLGNALLSIMSAFFLALMTDRILLIDGDQFDIRDLFCQPFEGSDWALPKELKISYHNLSHTPYNNRYKLYPFGGFQHEMAYHFACGDGLKEIENSQILFMWDFEQWWVPYWFLGKENQEKLNILFPHHNPATYLAHYLLHPHDEVWADILDTVKNSYTMDLNIGIQDRGQTIDPQEVKCLDTILKDPTQHKHVYIASMHDRIKNALLEDYNKTVPITQKYSSASGHFPRGERHDLMQDRTALHDIFVLSMANVMVLSTHSTFGYIAMALKGEGGYYYNDPDSEHLDIQKAQRCYLIRSHEPCTHAKFHPRHCKNPLGKEQLDKLYANCEGEGGDRMYVDY